MSDLQWLIVGGCPRSGTTGLVTLLNAHPEIGLIPEYNLENFFMHLEGIFMKEEVIEQKSWMGDINFNERDGAEVGISNFLKYVPKKAESYDLVVKALFESTFGKHLKVVGEKYPIYWEQDLTYLVSKMPNLKIFHIIRNPVDVMNSFMHRARLTEQNKDRWQYCDIRDACNIWIQSHNVAVNLSQKMTSNFLFLKYEDFLDDPLSTEETLRSFIGVGPGHFESLKPAKRTDRFGAFKPEERSFVEQLFGPIDQVWDEPLSELFTRFPGLKLISE